MCLLCFVCLFFLLVIIRLKTSLVIAGCALHLHSHGKQLLQLVKPFEKQPASMLTKSGSEISQLDKLDILLASLVVVLLKVGTMIRTEETTRNTFSGKEGLRKITQKLVQRFFCPFSIIEKTCRGFHNKLKLQNLLEI